MKKVSWADMTDDDDLDVPVTISKHGVKVQKSVPRPPTPDKIIDDNIDKNEL
jgi:hypothetical protein